MDIPEFVENPSEIGDDVLKLVFGFVEPLLEVGSCAKMTFYAAPEDAGPEGGLLIDVLDGSVKLLRKRNTWERSSTERAFFFLGLSSSSLAT